MRRPRSPTRPSSLVRAPPLATNAGFYTYLTANVVYRRVSDKALNPEQNEKSIRLLRAIRAHGDFAELVPITLINLFLSELNGAPTAWVHGSLAALFVARVLHSIGIQCDKYFLLRSIGFLGNLLILIGASLYNVRGALDALTPS